MCASLAIPLTVLAGATLWAQTSANHVHLFLVQSSLDVLQTKPAPCSTGLRLHVS
ncbi:hypothetical protein PF005_g8760 [Phytophthora fragariae]|uniref:RxLR effector protein n=1 Tax=Phytophthora fragariae TaxID=53985 RepID=A0A6A3ZJV9_9STRA|nr:hypothetical protein PF003_g39444 [Phytophthora fragariae]KAE8941007.1 hypothetical protein PF009_g9192 [Phytophthora fragariae]KAE9102128.1 hypothetical protein PF010_g14221 [Phytophthora fragariae]KAE9102922.1 hypothetical protein PF007_g14577 [Phytophthora fragariae]KAE9142031.1 hypothetical protein PF006_g12829 [Phytophthora fragariae]